MSAADQPGPWWPSPFGADDQHGMLNLVTDAKRRDALAQVRHGRMYDLGRVIDERVPVFAGRHFRQTLVTTAHHTNARPGADPGAGHGEGLGDNAVNWVIELVSATTQLGTHLDMLNHLQIGDRGYNGWTVSELAESWGTNRLGAETAPQVVTRGWLVDVPAVRGVSALERGDVVTVNNVKHALDDGQVEPGNAVLFHTGWGRHWTDPDRYLDGEPGPGLDLARWLVEQRVPLTGCDTWSYGPVPAGARPLTKGRAGSSAGTGP